MQLCRRQDGSQAKRERDRVGRPRRQRCAPWAPPRPVALSHAWLLPRCCMPAGRGRDHRPCSLLQPAAAVRRSTGRPARRLIRCTRPALAEPDPACFRRLPSGRPAVRYWPYVMGGPTHARPAPPCEGRCCSDDDDCRVSGSTLMVPHAGYVQSLNGLASGRRALRRCLSAPPSLPLPTEMSSQHHRCGKPPSVPSPKQARGTVDGGGTARRRLLAWLETASDHTRTSSTGVALASMKGGSWERQMRRPSLEVLRAASSGNVGKAEIFPCKPARKQAGKGIKQQSRQAGQRTEPLPCDTSLPPAAPGQSGEAER
ncbi:uncharacterized protein PSFLO_05065 [Pseudozyma flocculosa]|uniref:Uncharacterized protein n=1 Tax=Pseudozyma flocculosa TaxID=84751 RepID=A0A5C3F503_9BASI|nr:uncharacterized protein PSFLO_05065 [Pseudozyma flocculosa]